MKYLIYIIIFALITPSCTPIKRDGINNYKKNIVFKKLFQKKKAIASMVIQNRTKYLV